MDEHISVLLNESIEGLNIKEDGIYVDATLGRAGHSSHILSKLSERGKLYCFDKDNDAMEVSRNRLSAISPQFELIHSDFRKMKEELNKRGISSVDGILFDLGVSSPQLDNGERGFSYNYDARLDMRMNQEDKLDAYTIVNTYSETDLRQLIFNYGDERYASSIARNIVEARKVKPIVTTFELVDIIKRSVPAKYLRETHPAKRTFQAIRIEVNDELNGLKIALNDSLKLLKKGGRIAVITFHSLEDKIVKEVFKKASEGEGWSRSMPINLNEKEVEFKLITKKPILPSEKELRENNRSHSAKLRILEKI
jgi:16S rRNA (cytosine1402-N4)-methyltransferase